jgi:hypothetical protein
MPTAYYNRGDGATVLHQNKWFGERHGANEGNQGIK